MSINIINENADKNQGKYVLRSTTGSSGYVYRNIPDEPKTNFTLQNKGFNLATSSWSLSTGVFVDTTGSLVFDNDGLLLDTIIQNRGHNTLYFGINNETINTVSGFPLASGLSTTVKGPISKLWLLASTGTLLVNAVGTKYFSKEIIGTSTISPSVPYVINAIVGSVT